MKYWIDAAWERLRRGGRPALITAGAATVAWLLAADVIGHPDPIFAPTAVLVVLGESRGRRLRQTTEIVLGVAAGILIAELTVLALGPGALTLFIVLLLTIGPMIVAGASSTLVGQASLSALYLVVVAAPQGQLIPFRFIDALIGGAIAIAASQLTVARRPLAPLVATARQTYADVADLLGDLNDALETSDEPAAEDVLERAHRLHDCADHLRTEVEAAAETVRLRIRRRRRLDQLRDVEQTAHQLDHVVRNVGMLARHAAAAIRLNTVTPPDLRRAIEALSDAVRAAGESLATDLTGGDPDRHAGQADADALDAVRIAGKLLESGPSPTLTLVIGQIRTAAVDLLRGVGQDDADVLSRVDEAFGWGHD